MGPGGSLQSLQQAAQAAQAAQEAAMSAAAAAARRGDLGHHSEPLYHPQVVCPFLLLKTAKKCTLLLLKASFVDSFKRQCLLKTHKLICKDSLRVAQIPGIAPGLWGNIELLTMLRLDSKLHS